MTEQAKKSAEEIQAEKEAKALAKQAEKEAKAQKLAEEKASKQAEKEALKATREAEKQAKAEALEAKKAEREAEKQAKAKEREDKAREKEEAKALKLAQKEANRQPEQNGVRRPKPDTLCGKAWAIFDQVSAKNGTPATIGESMEIAKADNQNEANVRAEYARWRKFHGITGRLASPAETSEAVDQGATPGTAE